MPTLQHSTATQQWTLIETKTQFSESHSINISLKYTIITILQQDLDAISPGGSTGRPTHGHCAPFKPKQKGFA